MEIKGKVHCFFEQSGTFKNEFIKLGIPAEDYDIQNNFGETDHVEDLFKAIEDAYDDKPSLFDSIVGGEDLILAFFPCIYFCENNQLALSYYHNNYRKLSYKQRTEKILERMKNREYFYGLIVKMVSEVKNMDCMAYMAQFPDKFFDLAVVDPPYGINMDGGIIGISRKASNKVYTKKSWDLQAPDEAYFKELQRVSKQQIIWGANHFISRIPIDSSCWIVWNKENGNNPFADCELAWTSFKQAVRMFTFRWQGMLQGNMKHKEERIHPTQKPIALYAWIFSNFARGAEDIRYSFRLRLKPNSSLLCWS